MKRALKQFPSVFFNDEGTVEAARGRRLLPLVPDEDGYLMVELDGEMHYVHNLVKEAFSGPCPEGCYVGHWNGDITNNRIGNLVWVELSETGAEQEENLLPVPAGEHWTLPPEEDWPEADVEYPAVLPGEPEGEIAPDDLTQIDGVGPRYAEALNADGIFRFVDMVAAGDDGLIAAIKGAGLRMPASIVDWLPQAAIRVANADPPVRVEDES